MIQNRSRMVTFRMSEEEYEELQSAASARGARSVSEFARWGLSWIVCNCDRKLGDILFTPAQPHPRHDGPVSAEVDVLLRELNASVESLSRIVQSASTGGRV